jgi:hypothetical protein
MKTAIEWLEEQMETWGHFPRWMRDDIVKQAKEMENLKKLKHQLFIGKVMEIIGAKKTIELLKECNETFKSK